MTDTTKIILGVGAVGLAVVVAVVVMKPSEPSPPSTPTGFVADNGPAPVNNNTGAQVAGSIATAAGGIAHDIIGLVSADRDRAITERERQDRLELQRFCRANPNGHGCGPASANGPSATAASPNAVR